MFYLLNSVIPNRRKLSATSNDVSITIIGYILGKVHSPCVLITSRNTTILSLKKIFVYYHNELDADKDLNIDVTANKISIANKHFSIHKPKIGTKFGSLCDNINIDQLSKNKNELTLYIMIQPCPAYILHPLVYPVNFQDKMKFEILVYYIIMGKTEKKFIRGCTKDTTLEELIKGVKITKQINVYFSVVKPMVTGFTYYNKKCKLGSIMHEGIGNFIYVLFSFETKTEWAQK
ncbi:hypothetical protein BX661DRAFT_182743 [Kickxella alabastrina]|uniref:uncharacterized protein n=1 Tax=Kickxella alabastrina TaxID=61397 RepID=UPI00221EE759|nr:uncharacterized protein BX661DRAFT_182743 [Kickxella alabastrina]KAI7827923.1 hypothetical protein BX661DRAFT_182743 [Kickxella alabastrina]